MDVYIYMLYTYTYVSVDLNNGRRDVRNETVGPGAMKLLSNNNVMINIIIYVNAYYYNIIYIV